MPTPLLRPGVPRLPLAALAAVASLLCLAPGAAAPLPQWSQVQPTLVVGGLDMPVDIEVAPDGAVWFIALKGTVHRYDPATKATELVHEVPNVVTGGERGLVGFALAQDFAKNGTYYLYYTQRTADPTGGENRLVRMQDGKETLLVTVPGAKEHNGGRIVVAPDGTLFVGTGENQLRDPAQDSKSLLGKILHLDRDGKAVAGNLDGLVYSKGHRNVYGLARNPENGELWSTENSGWRRDEVNRIQAGGNYGYPECEGQGLNGVDTPCPTTKGYIFPLRTFYEDRTAAPTGATFWRGQFLWASLNEGSIHHLWQDAATGAYEDKIVLETGGMPILDLAVGPDDALYYSTTDNIHRVADWASESGGAAVDATTTTAATTAGPQTKGETSGKAAVAPLAVILALALLATARLRRTGQV